MLSPMDQLCDGDSECLWFHPQEGKTPANKELLGFRIVTKSTSFPNLAIEQLRLQELEHERFTIRHWQSNQ